ncbi:MAG TPA: hypothetical protein VLM38_00515 [Blastocatellia bacterium]|nr:hypothetical protein [Blastocatellia bacterium]
MSKVTSTRTLSRERGAISIKTLLALVLIGVVAFLAIKIAPVYVEQQRVVHDVNELARIAAVRGWKEDRINQDIKRISDEYSLPDNGINFVAKSERGVQIAVSYQRKVDLLVTTYEWKVDHTAVGKDL